MLSPDITPSQLKALQREEALFLIAHELLHRLMKIEPHAMSIDGEGEPSILATTDEGGFIADLLGTIDKMRNDYLEK